MVENQGDPRRSTAAGGWSVAEAVEFLAANLRVIVNTSAITAVLIVGVTLVLPRRYTARVVFGPDVVGQPAQAISGLAAQFGFAFASGSESSPEFYALLAQSWPVLLGTAESQYHVEHWYSLHPWLGTIAMDESYGELSGFERDGTSRTREKAVEHLRRTIAVSVDRPSGTVEVRVRSRWPDLSQALGLRVVDLVDSLNIEMRTARAAKEREFVEARLAEVTDSVHVVEEELEDFLKRNREFRAAPELLFQYNRLERVLQDRQSLRASLRQGLEQARIEEVRNTPVIRVIEAPRAPGVPDRRYLVIRAILAAGLGAVLGVVYTYLQALTRVPEGVLMSDADRVGMALKRLGRQVRSLLPGGRSA